VVPHRGGVRMIDDPLSLLSLGIWLLAAGMWPVGFLFGACSACCDEDECEECTHYRFGSNCSALLNEVSVDFGEYGTLTVDKFTCGPPTPELGSDDCVRDSPNQDAFSASFDLFESSIAGLPEPFLPACSQDEFNRPWLGEPIKFFAEAAVNTPAEIVAGCGTKQTQVIVRVSDTGLNDFRIVGVATVNTNNCTGGVIQNVPVVFEIDEVADLADFPDCAAAYLAFFNNLGVTVTVDYKPCACSKCTHYYHLPVDPPPFMDPEESNRCREKFDLVTMTAQCDTCSGSRTLADVYPDDNELRATPSGDVFLTDQIECDDFTTRLTANNIEFFYSVPIVDDCGCPACEFRMRIQLDFVGIEQLISFPVFEIRGTFDRCQQKVALITSFDDLNPQTPAWTNGIPAEIINTGLQQFADGFTCNIEEHLFTNNVFFTMNLELDMPCECGACCKDGDCRDNVSQDFCEDPNNAFFQEPGAGGGVWQGVGTSCCDDPCEE
jgi:hypothetical protein